MIVLYRVDDRLIHGQTVINLIPKYPCEGIIIVNDALAENKSLVEVYSRVVPSSVKVYAYNLEKAVRKLPEARASEKRYYVIVKNICDFKRLYDMGYTAEAAVSVGCVSRQENSVAVTSGFFLLPEEIDAYNYLDEKGYEFSILPMTAKTASSWKVLREKIKV